MSTCRQNMSFLSSRRQQSCFLSMITNKPISLFFTSSCYLEIYELRKRETQLLGVSIIKTSFYNITTKRVAKTTLFMIDEEKYGHHFDLPLFFNMAKQFLAPGGLSDECVRVSVISDPGASSELNNLISWCWSQTLSIILGGFKVQTS